MAIKKVTAAEFLSKFDVRVREWVRQLAPKYRDAVAVVLFESLEITSASRPGEKALAIGPSNTYKTLADVEGQHLGEVPSQFQYPTMYVDAAELRALPPVVLPADVEAQRRRIVTEADDIRAELAEKGAGRRVARDRLKRQLRIHEIGLEQIEAQWRELQARAWGLPDNGRVS